MTTSDRISATGLASDFWERVARTRHRLLMLDYDGTLVAFRIDRMAPRLKKESRALLRDIARTTRVVVVSGRPIAELTLMLEGLDLDCVGEHGWEERRHGAPTVRHPLPTNTERALEAAWAEAQSLPWAHRIERKRTSLMLHTRGLESGEAQQLEGEASALWGGLAPGVLDLRRVDGGVELRSRGADKGTAVLRLLAETPRDAAVVYIGDDQTDEDAFAAITGRGIGIRVGARKSTSATAELADPAAVVDFLERWRTVTR